MKINTLIIISFIICMFQNVEAQKYEQLFNGHDLSGWTIHGTEKWFVENGELICESGPDKQYGYLSTNKSYKNFELLVEFKLEANGNSGVFFRSSIEGTKISGWQVEVAPEGMHSGGVYESYGRGWLAQPDSVGETRLHPTDWNSMKIVVVNDKVTTYLNGKQIVSFKDQKIGSGDGFIALQIHDEGGIRVRWRNLLLQVLD
jgi:hypothetical protein